MKFQIAVITFSRIYASGAQAVAIVLLARTIPVSEFGLVNSFLAIAWFVVGLSDLGTTSLVTRARAVNHNSVVAGCFRLTNLTSWVATVACILLALVLADSPLMTLSFAALGASFAIEKNIDCKLGVPIADGSRLIPALSVVVRRTATLLVFTALLLAGAGGVVGYCLSGLVGAFAGMIHFALASRGRYHLTKSDPLGRVLRMSAPFFVSNVSAQSRATWMSRLSLQLWERWVAVCMQQRASCSTRCF